MSKYNSRKTTVDGFTFDSKKEAKRYLELKQMEKDGLIHNLQLQVPFELIPPFEIEIDGKKRRRKLKTNRKSKGLFSSSPERRFNGKFCFIS